MKLFTRTIPAEVTWNEFYGICERAQAMSALLDAQNTVRVRADRPTLLRTAIRHNRVVQAIHDTQDAAFWAWAHAQDLWGGDLPLVRFASDPKCL